MDSSNAAIERTAIEACLAGGEYLRDAFDSGDTEVVAVVKDAT